MKHTRISTLLIHRLIHSIRLRSAGASLALLMAALYVSGCSVQQQVRPQSDFSAESDLEVVLSDEMLAYVLDLSGVLGVEPGEVSPFDLERLAMLMQDEPGLELVDADIPSNERLVMSVSADDLERVFTEGPNRIDGLIEVQESGDERTIVIELDNERIQQITELSPVAEESAVDFLLPPERMDEDEYVEYLAWAMEEYEQDTPIEDVIRNARIELEVKLPGDVVSVEGGEFDGNTVRFAERVVRLLTVRDMTRWSVTWRQ